jgi:hypothetical protein
LLGLSIVPDCSFLSPASWATARSRRNTLEPPKERVVALMQAQHASRQSSTDHRQRIAMRPHAQPHPLPRQIEDWQRALIRNVRYSPRLGDWPTVNREHPRWPVSIRLCGNWFVRRNYRHSPLTMPNGHPKQPRGPVGGGFHLLARRDQLSGVPEPCLSECPCRTQLTIKRMLSANNYCDFCASARAACVVMISLVGNGIHMTGRKATLTPDPTHSKNCTASAGGTSDTCHTTRAPFPA